MLNIFVAGIKLSLLASLSGCGERTHHVSAVAAVCRTCAGAVPRATSIAFGGAIFFGAYEYSKAAIIAHKAKQQREKAHLR